MVGRARETDEDLPLLEMLDASDALGSETREVGTEDQPSSRWMVLAAVGVVLLVAVMSWIFSASADDPAAAPASTEPDITMPPERGFEDPFAGVTANRPSTVEEAVELFAAYGLSGGVAYQVDENVVTVDLADGSVAVAAPSTRIDRPIGDMLLVTENTRSMAIDLDRRDIAFLVSAGASVVASNSDDEFVLIEESTGESLLLVGIIDTAPQLTKLDVPSGSQLLSVPGLDVFVLPPAGGTFRPNRTGYERVSEGRIVAGSAGGWIEETCTEELVCTVQLVEIDGARRVLPSTVIETPPLLAPDASHLLFETEEGIFLLQIQTGAIAPIDVSEGVRPRWSPDSSFVVGVRVANGGPELWALDVEARTTVLVDLDVLRAPSPTGENLVVYG